jgi:hypothetical protein
MKDCQRFAVIIFPNGLQGKVWATILRSQTISVIWECPDVPLTRTLNALHRQQMTPDLLVLDTRLRHLRPFQLSRWLRHHCPEIPLLLVNGAQTQILPAERQWAMTQGAADLLPGFKRTAPISSAAHNLVRALHLIDHLPLYQQAMIASLIELGLNPKQQNGQPGINQPLSMAHSVAVSSSWKQQSIF